MIGQFFYIFARPNVNGSQCFSVTLTPLNDLNFFKTYIASLFLCPIKLFERVRRQKLKSSKINGQLDMYQDRIWTEIFSNGTASNEGWCKNKSSKFCF